MADKNFTDLLDEIDACIFTGDALEDAENIEDLEDYIYRWRKAIDSYQLEQMIRREKINESKSNPT